MGPPLPPPPRSVPWPLPDARGVLGFRVGVAGGGAAVAAAVESWGICDGGRLLDDDDDRDDGRDDVDAWAEVAGFEVARRCSLSERRWGCGWFCDGVCDMAIIVP